MPVSPSKILICGGGVPGLALALAISDYHLDVTLTEPNPPQDFQSLTQTPDARTAAIMQKNADWLQELRVWDKVAPYAGRLETMRIIDDSAPPKPPSRPHDFKSSDLGEAAFAFNTPVQLLRAALWEALPPSIYKHNGQDINYEDYDLIIAADGRHSPAREHAGITARFDDTGQSALVFIIRMTQPHNNISTEIHRPNGPVTFVPLADPYCASVVFVDRASQQDDLLAQGPQAIESVLQKICGALVQVISEPNLIPLSFMHVDRLFKGNTIVMGEAAHVLHPLGAQGLNLSLQDARVLADLLRAALASGTPINDTIHVALAYAKARQGDHALRAMGIKASLGFLRRGYTTGGIRRAALNFLDTVPTMKKALMRFAS